MSSEKSAEVMLRKLLLHNKLITESQFDRVLREARGSSSRTLPEEILGKRMVQPELMKKIVKAILGKGLAFKILNEKEEQNVDPGSESI